MIAIVWHAVIVQAHRMTYRTLLLALTLLPAPPASRPVQVPPLPPALSPLAAVRTAPASAIPSRVWVVPATVVPARSPLAPVSPVSPVGQLGRVSPLGPVGSAGPGYRWPVAGQPVVTRRFSPPPRPWLAGHRGVDIAGTSGEAIRAAGAGVVAFAGVVAGTGVVSVDHPGGLRTTYEPVLPLVHAGQRVTAGQPIGALVGGHPGCPVAACLHWGLRRGAEYLDPLLLLHAAPVRLYPA